MLSAAGIECVADSSDIFDLLAIRLFHLRLLGHIEAQHRRERRRLVGIRLGDDIAAHRFASRFEIASPTLCRRDPARRDARLLEFVEKADQRTRAEIQYPYQ